MSSLTPGGTDADGIPAVISIAGAGVGKEVCKTLLDDGAWLNVFNRSQTFQKEIEMKGGITIKGDALDAGKCKAVMESIDDLNVVVSTIGGTTADPKADSEGNINLINAAKERGVQRFVLVTSIGTGDSKQATPPNVYEALEPVLVEKAKAEEALRASGMEYVIIRPGGLKSEPATGKGVLTEDTSVCGSITREDVAELVAKCLWSDEAVKKTVSAVDSEQVFGEAEFATIAT